MSDVLQHGFRLPPEQQTIRDKCFHPSGTFVEFPIEDVEPSIPARFEKIVRMYPSRLAVKTKNRALTYDELNRAANRLARAILSRREPAEEPVGLFLTDGAHLITAHLAVLKARKFAMSLDPSAPQNRTAHLLTDSQTALVITDVRTDPIASVWSDKRNTRINVEEPNPIQDDDNIELPISSSAFSYLRYTSGSTGQAKGGLKTHRHVLHAVMNATNNFHICPDDRSVLLTRDASFGKYAFEVLLNGAALCPFYVKEEGLGALAEWLNQERITLYYSFPSAFRHLPDASPACRNFPSLRLIRLEGEPVFRSDVELYKKYFSPNCLLANSFSSTETGPVCLYFVDKQTEVAGTSLPAGYPVDGVEILLLDEFGKAADRNESGEIVVKSAYLSSGYWQRPDLNQTKFVAQADRGEEKVYFTGDLGRRSENGCVELLGRKDFQVKIRGFRVDVGEVEAVLAVHSGVKEVAVSAKKDPSENIRLVAYVVPHSGAAPSISDLRDFLTQRLFDYMIPELFVMLERLPMLPTGKVDRRALPDPGNARPNLNSLYAAPATATEKQLTSIWSEVLSVNQVGIHDNFFDLGGHSLTASRVISRVIQTFQLELPVKALFDAPTIAGMAAIITQNQAKRASDAELTQMLREVEAMTEEEAEKLLAAKT